MVVWKFHGSEDHGPMWWAVEMQNDGTAAVLESYDCGASWGCNCVQATEQDAWDFISGWFSQFYGH